jgi:RNA polymerase sigma-70 factor (ECF subfamily)
VPIDPNTLDAMYRRHAPSVFRRARRLLGSDADAQEIVQDVFLSLFEHPEQYEGRSALTTFLYTATTHAALNRIRDRKNRMRLLTEHTGSAPMDVDPRMTPEQLSHLHGLLRRMPEPLGIVAIHYYVDDLTHEDIARLLGCSRRHVGNLVERVAEWAHAEEEKTP